jgi:hypothetical protein
MTEPTVAGALSAAADQELLEFVRLCADFDWRNSEIQTRRVLREQLGWRGGAEEDEMVTPSGAVAQILGDDAQTDSVSLDHTDWQEDLPEEIDDDHPISIRFDELAAVFDDEFDTVAVEGTTFDGELGLFWMLEDGTRIWLTDYSVVVVSPSLASAEDYLEDNPEAFDELLDYDGDDEPGVSFLRP